MSPGHVPRVLVLMQRFICSSNNSVTTKAELHSNAVCAGCVCTVATNMYMDEQLGPKLAES